MMHEYGKKDEQRATGLNAMPYLIFSLASSTYAIPVNQVREIITTVTLTPVPGAPDYLAGVTNLRGHILPIIDLRKRFDLALPEKSYRPCFIVLMIESDETVIEFGIAVDQVVEVMKLKPTDIDAAPAMHDLSNQLIFNRVAKTNGGFKLILDTPSLLQQLKSDIGTTLRTSGAIASVA